jgi:hypothetical protein
VIRLDLSTLGHLPADERLVAKLVGRLDAVVASGAQRTVGAAIARA